jgi:hypothetical protein
MPAQQKFALLKPIAGRKAMPAESCLLLATLAMPVLGGLHHQYFRA